MRFGGRHEVTRCRLRPRVGNAFVLVAITIIVLGARAGCWTVIGALLISVVEASAASA
jgi:hypothetical protein